MTKRVCCTLMALALVSAGACGESAPDNMAAAGREPEQSRLTPRTSGPAAVSGDNANAAAAGRSGIGMVGTATASAPPPASSPTANLPPTTTLSTMKQPGSPPTAAMPSAACLGLRSCCSTLLVAHDKTLCLAIAEDQTESLCTLASENYCAPPTAADACTQLTSCCATLEDDQEDCQAVADAAVTTDCSASLDELCPNLTVTTTSTTPRAGVCAMLDTTCCSSLEDDEDIEECQAAVSSANDTMCQDALDALCAAGGDD